MSLNSFGPLISLSLRSRRSSLVADGSLIRSISWAAISDAFAALFGADALRRVVSSLSSTSRRMASGRAGLSVCLAAQASHTFTQFGRKTDGRYGIMPGGATAFLCTRGHMLPFLFTFIIYRPSGDLQSPRRKAAVITGTSRRVCPIGCSCPICRTRLRTPSTTVSQSDFSEWPEAGLRTRSARTS